MFAGDLADYDVSFVGNQVVVAAVATGNNDGTDTLTNVELLQFKDGVFEIVDGSVVAYTPPPDSGTNGGSGGSGSTGSGSDIVRAPSVQQPTEASDLVGYHFEGLSGSDNRWVTIGQPFVQGDLYPGEWLTLSADSNNLPVQLNSMATHDDGSVRHGILTFKLPAGSGSSDAMLSVDPIVLASSATDITPQDVLANTDYDLQVEFSLGSGKQTIDAKQALSNALADDRIKAWIEGPQVSEFVFRVPVDDHLLLELDIRAYNDDVIRTDVIVRNEWTFDPEIGTQVYDVAIIQNGETVFVQNDIQHHRNANWHHEVWTEPHADIHIVRDANYMIKSGAVPAYDLSIGVAEQTVADAHEKFVQSDMGPLGPGTIKQNMLSTGQTEGAAVGLLTGWGVNWLQSQDERAEAVLMGNADAAGSVPWHFREENTFEHISIDEHPHIRTSSRGGSGPDALPNPPDSSELAGWTPDIAHQPALNYLPYLLSGNLYYLENLKAQANYNVTSNNPIYRGYDEGIVYQGQIRGTAWSLAKLGDAAWIVPDEDSFKGYFNKIFNNNLDYFVAKYIDGDTSQYSATSLNNAQMDGETTGYWRVVADGVVPPWQQDFMALSLAWNAIRGFEQAGDLLDWSSNFNLGRFINEENGFNPHYGSAYHLTVQDVFGNLLETWAEIFDASFGSEALNIDGPLPGYPNLGGGYAGLARGATADILSHTGSIEAVEAFGFIVGETANMNLPGNPKWAMAPLLPNGEYLSTEDHKIGTVEADGLIGTARNELLIGRGGNDSVEGGGGLDLLLGGDGNDILDGGYR